jgi:hypothetical protein
VAPITPAMANQGGVRGPEQYLHPAPTRDSFPPMTRRTAATEAPLATACTRPGKAVGVGSRRKDWTIGRHRRLPRPHRSAVVRGHCRLGAELRPGSSNE